MELGVKIEATQLISRTPAEVIGTCWNIGWNIGFTVYQIHPTKNELLAGDQQTIKKPWPNSPMKTES